MAGLKKCMQGESVVFYFFVSQCILGSYLKKLCTTESVADSLSGISVLVGHLL